MVVTLQKTGLQCDLRVIIWQKWNGLKERQAGCLYLLSNKTFISCLLCFVPCTLKFLTESWVDWKEKKKLMKTLSRHEHLILLWILPLLLLLSILLLPRRECGWQTSGVSKVSEYTQVLGSETWASLLAAPQTRRTWRRVNKSLNSWL